MARMTVEELEAVERIAAAHTSSPCLAALVRAARAAAGRAGVGAGPGTFAVEVSSAQRAALRDLVERDQASALTDDGRCAFGFVWRLEF